ncbi:hypothetical protein AC579_3637 [Pseudocercospora musae]|uniref:Uncharacterized protein n=1 Tax=Pseudocercospora musae TaxID=113226 RepID=A0A139ISS6_9PEZI|nr:hypothetical protein AC579_3637 [Pseudocercospora musae]
MDKLWMALLEALERAVGSVWMRYDTSAFLRLQATGKQDIICLLCYPSRIVRLYINQVDSNSSRMLPSNFFLVALFSLAVAKPIETLPQYSEQSLCDAPVAEALATLVMIAEVFALTALEGPTMERQSSSVATSDGVEGEARTISSATYTGGLREGISVNFAEELTHVCVWWIHLMLHVS